MRGPQPVLSLPTETKNLTAMNIYNAIILDESGSMSSIYRETLASMNEVLSGIKKNQEEFPDQHHFVTIVTFEGEGLSGVKTRRDRVPAGSIEPFTQKDYRPGGCTPLYDAMGQTLSTLEGLVYPEDKVIATIITDGMENASQEYSGRTIKNMVSRLREKGWAISYIGANQDSVEVAKELNIGNAMNFVASPEGLEVMCCRFYDTNRKMARMLRDDIDLGTCEDLFDEEKNQ